jgi:hypothetical protein
MPRVGFEPTISVFERAEIFRALDRAVTLMDIILMYYCISILFKCSDGCIFFTLSDYCHFFTPSVQHVLAKHDHHQIHLYVAVSWCTILFYC